MSPRRRAMILAASLATALAAAGWVGGEERVAHVDPSTAIPAPRRERTTPAPASAPLDVEQLAALRRAEPAGDMFATRSWDVTREIASPKPAAPPEPPRFPYSFFGRLNEGAHTTIFLSRNDEILIVRAGDTIAGTWRIDEVNDGAVALTYLPLSRPQTLDIGQID